MKKTLPFILFVALANFSSCGQKTFDEKMTSLYQETVPLIYSDELEEKMANVIILDTRAPEEYAVSHIQGAQMIDYDQFTLEHVKSIPKDAEVIVYCSVGYRSERIGEKMQDAGYQNVKNLYGGIFDWKNQGNQVVNRFNLPTDSVHTYNKSWGQWLYRGIKVD